MPIRYGRLKITPRALLNQATPLERTQGGQHGTKLSPDPFSYFIRYDWAGDRAMVERHGFIVFG
jgi:hypothetical protein